MKKLIILLLLAPILSLGQDENNYKEVSVFRKIFKNKNRRTNFGLPRSYSDILVVKKDIYENGKRYFNFDYRAIELDSLYEYATRSGFIDGKMQDLPKKLWYRFLTSSSGEISPYLWVHSNSRNSIYEDQNWYQGRHISYNTPKDNSGEHTVNLNEDFEFNAGIPFKFITKYVTAKELTPPYEGGKFRDYYQYSSNEEVFITRKTERNNLQIRPLIEPSIIYVVTIGMEKAKNKFLDENNFISYEINLIPKPNKNFHFIDRNNTWAYYTLKNRNQENIIKIKIIKKKSGIEYYNEEKIYGGDDFKEVFVDQTVSKLQILREDDKIYFTINGKLIDITENHNFLNNTFLLYSRTKRWDGGYTLAFDKKLYFQDNIGFISGFTIKKPIKTKKINSEWSSSGSGFFVSTSGYIATNYHVIEDSNFIEIEHTIKGIKHTYEAEVVQTDPYNDLAILKVPNLHVKTLGNIPYYMKTRTSDVGTSVFALGYPMALNGMGKEIKFTDGKVSSKTGFNGDIRTYQTTTPIQGGNSGGPLFDYNGNLIGINSAKISSDKADNVSYSIKTSYLNNLMDILPESISVPSENSISKQTLVNKIKVLSNYVVLIKVK